MTPVRAQELIRDFIRSRHNWDLFGWPSPPLYTVEDVNHLRMLETERISGRVQIEGKIVTIADYPEIPE